VLEHRNIPEATFGQHMLECRNIHGITPDTHTYQLTHKNHREMRTTVMCLDQISIRCKYTIIILTSVREEEVAKIVSLRLAEG
jgi:hypothetical protein